MIWALHGNVGSPADWDTLGLPAKVLDLWSGIDPARPPGLESWAEGFCKEVRASGDDDPILLGYSLGGRLALHAMAEAPDLWKAAIIVSAHPGLAEERERRQRLERDLDWARKARSLPWPQFLDEWNAQPVFASSDEDGDQTLRRQRSLEPLREAIAAAFEGWSLGRQVHLGGHLFACHFPVLWVTGSLDQPFTELAEAMESVLIDLERVIVPDCGHRVPLEKPAELAECIRDFLSRRLSLQLS